LEPNARSDRGQWGSKLGFVLAASGSAIGLGNIVFFGANAYRFGAGAFYLAYLLALVVVGIPVLISELGLGSLTHQAFPQRWMDVLIFFLSHS
jgi:NSS family neurotransmitter:Na+ symporter